MEEDVEKGRPIALIASSIAAVLVIGLLLLYKPQKTEKTPDLDAIETHVETSYDTQEIASEPTVELNIEIVEAEKRYARGRFAYQSATRDHCGHVQRRDARGAARHVPPHDGGKRQQPRTPHCIYPRRGQRPTEN